MNDIVDLGMTFDIGFVLALSLQPCTLMLSVSQMSKLVSKETRGSMLGLSGVIGSIIIAVISALVGYLYDNVGV